MEPETAYELEHKKEMRMKSLRGVPAYLRTE